MRRCVAACGAAVHVVYKPVPLLRRIELIVGFRPWRYSSFLKYQFYSIFLLNHFFKFTPLINFFVNTQTFYGAIILYIKLNIVFSNDLNLKLFSN